MMNELTGAALDWAVHVALYGSCEGHAEHDYSTDWAQGGPIIEREAIQLTPDEYTGTWSAYMTNEGEPYVGTGQTPLIAAMRCYVASQLGDEVEIPEGLKNA
jgi:hypothetical protein